MKPNCHKCKYKRNNPGDTHIRCEHPSNRNVLDKPILNVLSILAGVGRVQPTPLLPSELNIKGNPYGIKQGWFNYPFNFDPTWLENCDGYEPRE